MSHHRSAAVNPTLPKALPACILPQPHRGVASLVVPPDRHLMMNLPVCPTLRYENSRTNKNIDRRLHNLRITPPGSSRVIKHDSVTGVSRCRNIYTSPRCFTSLQSFSRQDFSPFVANDSHTSYSDIISCVQSIIASISTLEAVYQSTTFAVLLCKD